MIEISLESIVWPFISFFNTVGWWGIGMIAAAFIGGIAMVSQRL